MTNTKKRGFFASFFSGFSKKRQYHKKAVPKIAGIPVKISSDLREIAQNTYEKRIRRLERAEDIENLKLDRRQADEEFKIAEIDADKEELAKGESDDRTGSMSADDYAITKVIDKALDEKKDIKNVDIRDDAGGV